MDYYEDAVVGPACLVPGILRPEDFLWDVVSRSPVWDLEAKLAVWPRIKAAQMVVSLGRHWGGGKLRLGSPEP